MTALYALFLILVALDGWTTYKILKAGGRELNPMLRWIIAHLGLKAALISTHILAMAVGFFLAYSAARHNAIALYTLIGGTVVFGLAVANNIRALRSKP